MASTAVFFSGLGLGASLIMAIGAQNAYVLRMGVQRRHVLLTVAACIVIDIVLIGLGVAGAGAVIEASPLLMAAARWGGAAFLLWYGLRCWSRLGASTGLDRAPIGAPISATAALGTVTAMSLLNPHVYLDTVVLLGSIGGRYPADLRPAFSAGAMVASLLWFSMLGFGASRFSSVLARPRVWLGIEVLTGAVMVALALKLICAG